MFFFNNLILFKVYKSKINNYKNKTILNYKRHILKLKKIYTFKKEVNINIFRNNRSSLNLVFYNSIYLFKKIFIEYLNYLKWIKKYDLLLHKSYLFNNNIKHNFFKFKQVDLPINKKNKYIYSFKFKKHTKNPFSHFSKNIQLIKKTFYNEKNFLVQNFKIPNKPDMFQITLRDNLNNLLNYYDSFSNKFRKIKNVNRNSKISFTSQIDILDSKIKGVWFLQKKKYNHNYLLQNNKISNKYNAFNVFDFNKPYIFYKPEVIYELDSLTSDIINIKSYFKNQILSLGNKISFLHKRSNNLSIYLKLLNLYNIYINTYKYYCNICKDIDTHKEYDIDFSLLDKYKKQINIRFLNKKVNNLIDLNSSSLKKKINNIQKESNSYVRDEEKINTDNFFHLYTYLKHKKELYNKKIKKKYKKPIYNKKNKTFTDEYLNSNPNYKYEDTFFNKSYKFFIETKPYWEKKINLFDKKALKQRQFWENKKR